MAYRTVTWHEVTEMYQHKPRSSHARRTSRKLRESPTIGNPTVARDALRYQINYDGLTLHEYPCGAIEISGRVTRFD